MGAGPAQPNQISSFSTLSNLMTGPPNHYFIYSRVHFFSRHNLKKLHEQEFENSVPIYCRYMWFMSTKQANGRRVENQATSVPNYFLEQCKLNYTTQEFDQI
jgi:hypothetical protein